MSEKGASATEFLTTRLKRLSAIYSVFFAIFLYIFSVEYFFGKNCPEVEVTVLILLQKN